MQLSTEFIAGVIAGGILGWIFDRFLVRSHNRGFAVVLDTAHQGRLFDLIEDGVAGVGAGAILLDP